MTNKLESINSIKDLSDKKYSVLIKIDDRFYYDYTKDRIKTAFSVAGAKHFLPSDLMKIKAHYSYLEAKGKNPIVCINEIYEFNLDKKEVSNG